MSAPVHYDHLIVGAGMVADAAARGIREAGDGGSIGILGAEPDGPFPRPALSKSLWLSETTPEERFYDTGGLRDTHVHLDDAVTAIDPDAHTVTTASGAQYGYGRLLLATGGSPRRIDGLDGDRVVYLRTVADYRRLQSLVSPETEVVVVGAGFIGTEIASALVRNDVPVTLVHSDDVLGDHFLAPTLAHELETLFIDNGVRLRAGVRAQGGVADADGVTVRLSDGDELRADVVVVGLGIEPGSEIARAAGLALSDDGGIIVDSGLATSAPDVYAAGDVATYPDRILGRTRVEHEDNALTMGATAGRILAGADETYDHTPYFWTQWWDTWLEAIGSPDPSQPFVEDDLGEGKRVIYHLDETGTAVVGVLMWNVSDKDAARELLARQPLADGTDPATLLGTIR